MKGRQMFDGEKEIDFVVSPSQLYKKRMISCLSVALSASKRARILASPRLEISPLAYCWRLISMRAKLVSVS